jgi:hypothetical protein
MEPSSLAVSIITYRRSHLLDLCLRSLNVAMSLKRYPIYVVIQDADSRDLAVLSKYKEIITEITYVEKLDRGVEDLINSNRVIAWEKPLCQYGHKYVICLEDDVEVSRDIFEFTEAVLEQNAHSRNFWGINYGSFEKPDDTGTYSKLSYGIHGPASLVGLKAFKKFKMQKLMKLKGIIPWDAWVEHLVKTGFMATSNVSRYKDNGLSGTHASFSNDSNYFEKLNESFEYGQSKPSERYYNYDLQHHWRADCTVYRDKGRAGLVLRFMAVRTYQILRSHL